MTLRKNIHASGGEPLGSAALLLSNGNSYTADVMVIIIIIIIIVISFMQGINTYFPETNHVPRVYSVSAILSLLFMVPVSLIPTSALL